jgi:UDP-glucose 4-epimerase
MSCPVVVTGASGFVGKALLSQLRRTGVAVTGVSRRRLPGLQYVADYADTPVPEGAVLVHLAQDRDPLAPFDQHAIDVCETVAAKPWGHIVYASSAIVYGDQRTYPRRTEEPVAAASEYARVKIACEEIFGAIGATCLRFANLYGPSMGRNTVIADIVRQIPGRGPLRLRDTTAVRDFLWIEDAARCLAAACSVRSGGVFNAGSGLGSAIGDVARIALAVAGQASRPVIAESTGARASHLVLNIDSSRDALKWSPQTDLASGLAALLSHSRG